MAAEFRDFAVFYAHLGDPPSGFSLDRIDNERGYFPGNVRWADRTTQARNSRKNHIVSFNGISKPIAAWSEDLGIRKGLLYLRLQVLHWPVEKALTEPVSTYRACSEISAEELAIRIRNRAQQRRWRAKKKVGGP